MLKEENESLKKESERKDRLIIEQQQQLQAALARLAGQQQQEVAAAGWEAVQRQEQQQGKAAAAALVQHTQQEGSPPDAGNAALACMAAAPDQPAVAPMAQADSPLHLEPAADRSDGERMQATGQSDDKEMHEAGAAPESLVHSPAGFVVRQVQAQAVAVHSPSAECPDLSVSAASGRPEGVEPGSADGEPAAAHQLHPVALSGQVKICFC